jgi:hypothetical protein
VKIVVILNSAYSLWNNAEGCTAFQDKIPTSSDAELAGLDVECDDLSKQLETTRDQIKSAETRLKQLRSALTAQVWWYGTSSQGAQLVRSTRWHVYVPFGLCSVKQYFVASSIFGSTLCYRSGILVFDGLSIMPVQ